MFVRCDTFNAERVHIVLRRLFGRQVKEMSTLALSSRLNPELEEFEVITVEYITRWYSLTMRGTI